LSPWSQVKAAISLLIIALNLVFWCIPLFALALAKGIWPGARSWADPVLDSIYRIAMRIDDAWLKGVMGVRWSAPPIELSADRSVIVLANHTSWADILLMQSVIVRRGPVLKFLVKRELLSNPIFRVIFWAFDFPILRRRARTGEDENERRNRDLEAIKEACRILTRRPAALVNFAEGTRFSEAKRLRQASPYIHVLEPKVGGLSALLDALEREELEILDLTLKYRPPQSFWMFLAGESGPIEIDAEILDADEVPDGMDARADWLAARWARKDRMIDAFRSASRN
jgi:1-acyl-sn-glycerol-3-phosphate acyltransferase